MMVRLLGLMALLALVAAGPLKIKNTPKGAYRLPRDILPETYNIYLVPYLDNEGDRTFTFDGMVEIRFQVTTATNLIRLHSYDLVLEEPKTILQTVPPSATPVKVLFHRYDVTYHFLDLELDATLDEGEYTLGMTFTGKLNDEMEGFYRSSYLQDGETKWMATTQFESTSARRAFPCFDEPEWKAKFTVNIARMPELHVLGNMPLKSTSVPDPELNGRVWDTFYETEKMSTYLVAFIVSDFHMIGYNKFMSVYARRNSIERASYALQVGPKVLKVLEEFTGLTYELPKLDHVAIPDFAAGAMENWGLITYRETALLYDPIESTESNKQRVATVVAHEIAHMWFGDYVTLEWWSYTWLNEGFARYLQAAATDIVHPEWKLMDQFVVDHLQTIFRADSLSSSQPLTKECETPAEISAMFGSISYSKGGSVLRMLDHTLTRPTFSKAINKYLTKHVHSTVTPADLFEALDEQAVIDVALPADVKIAEVMVSWTEKPGYPYITVTRSHEDMQTIVISQERYLLNASPTEETLWWIPLTWTKASDVGTKAFEDTKAADWLKGVKQASFNIPVDHEEWIIFNNQQTGYYRVAYDADFAWPLIVKALQSPDFENIHVVNRAQIIDDALNLARVDVGSYENALEATLYLKNEVEYIPWLAAFNNFIYMETRLYNMEGFKSFQTYILQSLDKVYNLVSFDETPFEVQTSILNRINVLTWACKYGNQDCIDNAKNEFKKMIDENGMVSANKKSVVYCTALKHGTNADWETLWEKYTMTDLGTEQVLILNALGCTNDPVKLNEYLMKSIDAESGIRKQDVLSVFSSVYSNPVGVDIAFNFFIDNFEEIPNFYVGDTVISNAITGIASKLTTKEQVDKLQKFIDDNADGLDSSVTIAGEKALEAARADLAWSDKNAATILKWMDDNTKSGANAVTVATSVIAVAAIMTLFNL